MHISSLPAVPLWRTVSYAIRHLGQRKQSSPIEVKSYNLTLGEAYQREQEKLLKLISGYQTVIFDGDGTLYKFKLFGWNWSRIIRIKLIQQFLKPHYFRDKLIEKNELALLKYCLDSGKRIIIVTDNFNRSVAERLQQELSQVARGKNLLVSATKGPITEEMLEDSSCSINIIWAAHKDRFTSTDLLQKTLIIGDSKIDVKFAQNLGSDCLSTRPAQKDHLLEWFSIFGIINKYRVFRKQYVSSINEALTKNITETKQL